MSTAILGIDIAKKKFDVALYVAGKYKHKTVPNSASGFEELSAWLHRNGIEKVHACMEATGIFWQPLATYLHEAGQVVSVVNPLRIKKFGEAELSRTKTDKADARLIARFCERMTPTSWQPESPEIKTLQALGRRRDALVAMRTQELNRDMSTDPSVNSSIETVIAFLDQEIDRVSRLIKDHIDKHPDLKRKRELLKSIPGVGDITAEAVLSETNGFENFRRIEQVVAYIGLSPQEKSSGTSVRGQARLCKMGSARLRRILYMPALVALQHNPAVKALYTRLKEKSKNGIIIACACMKKLLHIMFGVIKNNQPFDPEYHLKFA
jgi:transposase